jgi:hypothetical protein
MRDGVASYCSLDTKSCAREESRLRGFCDGVAVEVSINKSGGMMTLDFPGFSPFLPSFFAAAVASLTALAMALVASLLAFLASHVLWLRILFLSFSGSNARSAALNSSGTTTLSDPNLTPLGSTLSQVAFTFSSSTG